MTMLLIYLALLVQVGGFAVWLLRRPDQRANKEPTRHPATYVASVSAIESETLKPQLASTPVPEALAAFEIVPADRLPDGRRNAYVQMFRDIPRPSRLMHQLLSPSFINDASSAQLADLIRPEPLLVARILAVANSPAYAQDRPVSGIDAAIMVLGVDNVRTQCLKTLVAASFKSPQQEVQHLLDVAWAASALASELTQHLSQALAVERRGELVSAVVLSFLGRLASVASTPAGILASIPPRDLLARKSAEQQKLGLSASEIGRLLMAAWELPDEVTADAADLDLILLGRGSGLGSQRAQRLALAYLCARLGERLACGELKRLDQFDLTTDNSPELYHLRHQLDATALKRWSAVLKEPAVAEALARLQTLAATPPQRQPTGEAIPA